MSAPSYVNGDTSDTFLISTRHNKPYNKSSGSSISMLSSIDVKSSSSADGVTLMWSSTNDAWL